MSGDFFSSRAVGEQWEGEAQHMVGSQGEGGHRARTWLMRRAGQAQSWHPGHSGGWAR